MAKGIWVFAEVKDNNIRKVTFELLSQGRKMAEKLGEELVAVLLGVRGGGPDRPSGRVCR
jgi:electron transfer flavoprotein alpha subunit